VFILCFVFGVKCGVREIFLLTKKTQVTSATCVITSSSVLLLAQFDVNYCEFFKLPDIMYSRICQLRWIFLKPSRGWLESLWLSRRTHGFYWAAHRSVCKPPVTPHSYYHLIPGVDDREWNELKFIGFDNPVAFSKAVVYLVLLKALS
jgi:hypothetical protein